MLANLSFGKKIGLSFFISGFIFVVIATLSLRSTQHLVKNNSWVTHTLAVRMHLSNAISMLTEIESAQRGYVATGDRTFLEPVRTKLDSVRKTLEDTQQLTEDNAVQQQRLTELKALVEARIEVLLRVIEIRERDSHESAVTLLANGNGRTLMAQVRKLVEQIDETEKLLLAKRDQQMNESVELAQLVTIWGGCTGLLLSAVLGYLMLRTLSSQLGTAVNRIRSSATELQASANQQATSSKEQSTAMTEIGTTMSELLATSRQIADGAQKVAQIADQSMLTAQGGTRIVESTQESILGIRRQVDVIVHHMLELGKKSQQIGAVIELVYELAEQTNILAINATIEAAGAGELGRRFVVVADEIRKLADRVGGSAKEIRLLIDDVRGAVNTTVMATEAGSKTVDAGSRQFGDVMASFRQIVEHLTTTTQATREIGLSTKQQSSAVEQVNNAVASTVQTTRELESSSVQTLQTAAQLTTISRDVLLIIQRESH